VRNIFSEIIKMANNDMKALSYLPAPTRIGKILESAGSKMRLVAIIVLLVAELYW
jgi:hypothetical protein